MDKRVLLTVAVCMGILFVWTKFFMPTPPKDQAAQSAVPEISPVDALMPRPGGRPVADHE